MLADPARKLGTNGYEIVALAASAGGLQALTEVLGSLPQSFPAALCVVQHLDPAHRSMLVEILSRHTPLRVEQARHGEHLAAGTVFIAPPDRHLLVNPDATLSLTQTAPVLFVRPSADVLFESVAASFGKRAIAVVLSGSGHDGATGVRAIKTMGGTVIVQDPRKAAFRGMPESALKSGPADAVLPLRDIGPSLRRLVTGGHGA